MRASLLASEPKTHPERGGEGTGRRSDGCAGARVQTEPRLKPEKTEAVYFQSHFLGSST